MEIDKTPTSALFKYVLESFNSPRFADILVAVGGEYFGKFFLWGLIFEDEEYFYAINPYTRTLRELQSMEQNPESGRVLDDEDIASLILKNIVATVEILAVIQRELGLQRIPSEMLFELVKFIFEEPELISIIQNNDLGHFTNNELIWYYDSELSLFYSIDPMNKEVLSLSSEHQNPQSGDLVIDQTEIGALLLDLMDALEAFSFEESKAKAQAEFEAYRQRYFIPRTNFSRS